MRWIFLLLLCLTCCEQPHTYNRAEALKWIRQCGGQLIADATEFYESIPKDLSSAKLQRRIENFYAAQGRLLTLSVQEDDQGRPVGLVPRNAFWSQLLLDDTLKRTLLSRTELLVSQVEVALGVVDPGLLSSDKAAALRAWLGDDLDRLETVMTRRPCTPAMRRLRPDFATRADFNWPPPGV